MNANLKIKVSYKLFHNSTSAPFAVVTAKIKDGRISLKATLVDEEVLLAGTKGGVVHDLTLRCFLGNVRDAVRRLLDDPDGLKFPFRWNEDTCLECHFQSNQ